MKFEIQGIFFYQGQEGMILNDFQFVFYCATGNCLFKVRARTRQCCVQTGQTKGKMSLKPALT